jgi:hypothetical protein
MCAFTLHLHFMNVGWSIFLGMLVAFQLGCGTRQVSPQPPEGPASRTLEVRADRDWQGTGVRAGANQMVEIQYLSGQWAPWPNSAYDATGCPQPGCDRVTNLIIRDANHAALIGRIGNGGAFPVNAGTTFRSSEPGEIRLRINDTAIDDNSGAITVLVSVAP